MPTIYKTVSQAQLQALTQQVNNLQNQVNDLDPEAAVVAFDVPTELSDGVGVGKLGKFDEEGKLIVAIPGSGSVGANAVLQITLNESGTPEDVQIVPATGYFQIFAMLAPGDQVEINTDEFGSWTFGFYNDEMDTPPEVEFVQFDSDPEIAAQNLAGAISATISTDVVSSAQYIGSATVQIAAGTEFDDQETTAGLRIVSLAPMGISTTGVGMMGELQNGGEVPIPGSRIILVDQLYSSPDTAGEFPIDTYIEAGTHWTPDADLEIEAANIAAAITTYFKNENEDGWNATSMGAVITMTRTIQGSIANPPVNNLTFSNWGTAPDLGFQDVGSYSIPQSSEGPFAGKILSVEDGVAQVSNKYIDEFLAAEPIIAGQRVTSGDNGDIRVAGNNDESYGRALTSANTSEPVLVRQNG